MRTSLITLTTVLLLEECSFVSATAGPIFAEFCPTIMDGWLCNRNPTGHWLEETCGEDSEANAQLEILAEFYFATGNRASSGPLFEMGWLSDCEFCDWDGIACNENGEVTAIEVGDNSEVLTGTIPIGIFNLTSLESLDIHGNEFTGKVPSELGLMTSLTNLKLHYNSFSSKMPDEVCLLGGTNGVGIYITADCAPKFPFPEVRCERLTCCDACYNDVLRDIAPPDMVNP